MSRLELVNRLVDVVPGPLREVLLVALALKTTPELQELWDRIGPEPEIEDQLSYLFDPVTGLREENPNL